MIIVVDGRIEAIGPPDLVEVPKGATEIRLDGQFVVPGLIDAHGHAERWALTRYLAYGVTAVRDAGGIQDSIIFLRDDVAAGTVDGPRLYISGAVIERAPAAQPGATAVRTANDIRRAVGNRVLINAAQVKLHGRIDQQLLRAALDEAQALATPIAVHLGRVDALTAARLGVDAIEHMTGVPEATLSSPAALFASHDDPERGWHQFELAWARLDSAALDRTARALVGAGVKVVPTLVRHDAWAHLADREYLTTVDVTGVPEAVRSAWDPAGIIRAAGVASGDFAVLERSRRAQDLFVRSFVRAGGLVAAGTDSPGPLLPPGASLHHELALLVEAGLTPAQALLAATRDAARLLEADSIGVLRVGALADFVVLGASPLSDIANTRRVERVVIEGTSYDPAGLRSRW